MKVSMKWKKDKIKVVGCVDFPQMKNEMWNEINRKWNNEIKWNINRNERKTCLFCPDPG